MMRTARIFAILLVFALALSLGAPSAFAREKGPGKITIVNPDSETEWYSYYLFYRILNLKGQDTSNPADGVYDAVTYTIVPRWEDFFLGEGGGASYMIAAGDATEEQQSTLVQIVHGGNIYYLNLTEQNAPAFADAAMLYTVNNNLDRDEDVTAVRRNHIGVNYNNDGTIVLNDMPLGYYLMYPYMSWDAPGTDFTQYSSGSIASLTSTLPNAEIYVKAVKPSISKTDDTISADVGQAVHYILNGKVPSTAGFEEYTYRFRDYWSTGLTFNNDISVTITHEGQEISVTDFVLTPYNSGAGASGQQITGGFNLDIPVTDYQDCIGDPITVRYSLTVNFQAVVNNAYYDNYSDCGSDRHEVNVVSLWYGHNPDNLAYTRSLIEEVYTSSIFINKYAERENDGNTVPLAGAKFVLMNSEGKYLKYQYGQRNVSYSVLENEKYRTNVPVINSVSWVTVTDAPVSGTDVLTDDAIGVLAAAAKQGTITAVTTDEDGFAAFDGLKDGTYYLVEVNAPDGYNRLTIPEKVVLQGEDADTAEGKTENVADGAIDIYGTLSLDSSSDAFSSVLNRSGAVLPVTGGSGATLLYAVGGTMTLAAAALLLTRKKRSES